MSNHTHPDPGLQPAILVIFGITGDLAHRKLLPALYHLVKDKLLHEHTEIVGVSRQQLSVEQLLETVEMCVLEHDNVCDPAVMADMKRILRIQTADPANGSDLDGLRQALDDIETEHGVCMNRLFYLSIPPKIYSTVTQNLGEHGLNTGCQHKTATSRLLVEKPFGYDEASAEQLIQTTTHYFDESQIFRIDHYLAKESVQNILTFRRHNPIFTDSWDGKHIRAINVIAHEKIGVEGRAGFYDQVGALRDLVQSHLLQLLALVIVDLEGSDDNHILHAAKQEALAALRTVDPTQAIRGQYTGYREEIHNPDSLTETYVRLQLESSAPVWQGTVITIETGKALDRKNTEIQIIFSDKSGADNTLTFRIQPNEGIDLELTAKKPGFEHQLQHVSMDFSYHGAFDEPSHPDAYERVLVDAVRGDHSLFATSDEVMATWHALQPILDYWASDDTIVPYTPGSKGPVLHDI